MAAIAPVLTFNDDQSFSVLWETLTVANGNGSPVAVPLCQGLCAQVIGTFDSNTMAIQGSLDGGTTWFTLSDGAGTPASFSGAGGILIAERPLLIRPFNTGGTTIDIDVYLSGHRRGM